MSNQPRQTPPCTPRTPSNLSTSTTNYYYNNNNNNSTNSNTPNTDIDLVSGAYLLAMGYTPTPAITNQLLCHLHQGVSVDLLCAVIEYTAVTAPRPGWAYANAVLTRQLAAGTKTADDFVASCTAYQQRKTKRTHSPDCYHDGAYHYANHKTVIEQRYNQRDYQSQEYSGIDGLTQEQLEEVNRL